MSDAFVGPGWAAALILATAAIICLGALVRKAEKLLLEISVASPAAATATEVSDIIYLNSHLKPVAPLPKMGGWALSPSACALMAAAVAAKRPQLVVEMGCGVSTVVIGYALKNVGRGRLISLEHDSTYLDATRKNLDRHGLADVVTLVHAPLRSYSLDNLTYMWYDLSALSADINIDMLLIDGPPGATGKLARFPALPLLMSRLSGSAVVVIDDCNRADERETVHRWLAAYPDFARDIEIHDTRIGVLYRGIPTVCDQ